MDMKQVLDKLFATNKLQLSSVEREVSIKKITLRGLKPVLSLLGAVISDMRVGHLALGDAAQALTSGLETDPGSILKLISTHYDGVMEVLVHVCDLSADELYNLPADDGALLVQGALMLNRDFFTNHVAPALKLMAVEREANATQQQTQHAGTASAQTA